MTKVVIQKAGKYQVQGKVRWCNPGEVVDATDWGKSLDRCVRTGYVARVVEAATVPVPMRTAPQAPVQATASSTPVVNSILRNSGKK